MKLSQKELSDFLGVSRAAVSQATRRDHKCKGYPVRAWAVYDGAGRVAGYEVPDHVVRRGQPEEDTSGEEPVQAALTEREPKLPSAALGGRSLLSHLDSSTRVSLLPEGEDYAHAASAGGTAYVVGKAIEEDNATAQGAVVVAGGGIGATIGGIAADQDDSTSTALGAFVGGLLGVAAGYAGIKVVANTRGRAGEGRAERKADARRGGRESKRAWTNGQRVREYSR